MTFCLRPPAVCITSPRYYKAKHKQYIYSTISTPITMQKMKSMKVTEDVYKALDSFLTAEVARTGNRRLTFSNAIDILLKRGR